MKRTGRPVGNVPVTRVLPGVRFIKSRRAWFAAVELATGKRSLRRLESGSRADAQAQRDEMALALKEGRLNVGSQVLGHERTVNDLDDEALARYWTKKTRYKEVASIFDRFVRPRIGHWPLSALDTKAIQDWYDWLKTLVSDRTGEPLSWQTREHIFNKLRAALSRAVEWGYLPRNPASLVVREQRPEADGTYTALTVEEFHELLRIATPDLRPMFITAVLAALRRGELAALRWRNIDLEAGFIEVYRSYSGPRKGRRRIEVPITSELHATLEHWRRDWGRICRAGHDIPTPDDLVFPVPGRMQMRNRGSHYQWPKMIAKVSGGRTSRLHDLRHTAATFALEATGDLKFVQELGGWKDQRMLQKYLHAEREYKRSRAAKINLGIDTTPQPATPKPPVERSSKSTILREVRGVYRADHGARSAPEVGSRTTLRTTREGKEATMRKAK